MAADEAQSEAQEDSLPEATIEPFLDMREPTFRVILRAASSKFNQLICPLMASVCFRYFCMFWNDHSKSCYIVDTLKTNLYHTNCPKCGSTNIQLSTREGRTGKTKSFRCDTCNNEWSSVHWSLAHSRHSNQFLFLLLFQPRLDSFQSEKVLPRPLL